MFNKTILKYYMPGFDRHHTITVSLLIVVIFIVPLFSRIDRTNYKISALISDNEWLGDPPVFLCYIYFRTHDANANLESPVHLQRFEVLCFHIEARGENYDTNLLN